MTLLPTQYFSQQAIKKRDFNIVTITDIGFGYRGQLSHDLTWKSANTIHRSYNL